MSTHRVHVREQLETVHEGVTPFVRTAVYRDALTIARRLRPEDLLDLHGEPPVTAMTGGFELSREPLTVVFRGRPVAMFGVVPWEDGSGVGNVWLLGTPAIEEIKTPFLRQSRDWLDHISRGFTGLRNQVHEGNVLHIKWLRWLEFTFIRRQHGFMEFAKCVNQ